MREQVRQAPGVLNASLTKGQVLQVWNALEGKETNLFLKTTVSYKDYEKSEQVTLSGIWTEIYDSFFEKIGMKPIGVGELKELLFGMFLQEEKILKIFNEEGRPVQASKEIVYTLFRRNAIVIFEINNAIQSATFTLKNRPYEGFTLEYKTLISSSENASFELTNPLEEVIGDLLVSQDWDNFVHLMVDKSTSRFRFEPLGKRVRQIENKPRANSGSSIDRIGLYGGKPTVSFSYDYAFGYFHF